MSRIGARFPVKVLPFFFGQPERLGREMKSPSERPLSSPAGYRNHLRVDRRGSLLGVERAEHSRSRRRQNSICDFSVPLASISVDIWIREAGIGAGIPFPRPCPGSHRKSEHCF